MTGTFGVTQSGHCYWYFFSAMPLETILIGSLDFDNRSVKLLCANVSAQHISNQITQLEAFQKKHGEKKFGEVI